MSCAAWSSQEAAEEPCPELMFKMGSESLAAGTTLVDELRDAVLARVQENEVARRLKPHLVRSTLGELSQLNKLASVPNGGTLAADPKRQAERAGDTSEPEQPPPKGDAQITNQLKFTRPSLPQPAMLGNIRGDHSAWVDQAGEPIFSLDFYGTRRSRSQASQGSTSTRASPRKRQRLGRACAQLSLKDRFKKIQWHEGLEKFQKELEWKHGSQVPDKNSAEYEREVSRQRAAKRALAAKRQGQALLQGLRRALAERAAAGAEEYRRLAAANQQLLLQGHATTDSAGAVMLIKKPAARPLDHGIIGAQAEVAGAVKVEKGCVSRCLQPARTE